MKITNELLNQLITEHMERLDEREVFVKIAGDATKNKKKYAVPFGVNNYAGASKPSGLTYGSLLGIYGMDGEQLDLSDEDIKRVIRQEPSNKEFKTLAWLLQQDINQDVTKAVSLFITGELNKEFKGKIKKNIESFITASNLKIDIENRKDLKPFGRLSVPMSDIAGEGELKDIKEIKVDSAYKAIFDAIPGGSLFDKFQAMEKFAKQIKDPATAPTLTDDENAFMVANMGLILDTLGSVSKEFESTAAGPEFEKFLALLLGGAVVGGESGATDMLGRFDDKEAYYSAKLYSSGDFKQALGLDTNIGITGIVGPDTNGNPVNPMYYIFGFKTQQDLSQRTTTGIGKGASAKYDKIYIFILEINWVKSEDDSDYNKHLGHNGYYTAQAIGPNGHYKGVELRLNNTSKQLEFKNYFVKRETFRNYAYEIPVMAKSKVNDLAYTVSQYLTDVLMKKQQDPSGKEVYVDNTLNAIIQVFKRLQNMERNTQEYNAVKSKEGSTDTRKYVKAISTDYLMLKTNYNKMFSSGEDTTTDITKINEKITPELLDKLIKEVILNK